MDITVPQLAVIRAVGGYVKKKNARKEFLARVKDDVIMSVHGTKQETTAGG
jgi:hypothetical protein